MNENDRIMAVKVGKRKRVKGSLKDIFQELNTERSKLGMPATKLAMKPPWTAPL